MRSERSSGILLHVTSLPGKFGIGDLGPGAFSFIDFLKTSGCRYWQFLPLGPTGYGNSPYQCLSAFAGNPLIVSPESLFKSGYLRRPDLPYEINFGKSRVDFPLVIGSLEQLLKKAFERFNLEKNNKNGQFRSFCDQNETWLNDYALFMTFKQQFGGKSWLDWPEQLRNRDPRELLLQGESLKSEIEKHKFIQFLFFEQWLALKSYAESQEIKLIGDLPLYVSLDSVDVWSKPDLFDLDENKKPLFVAGVPPDYFSRTGQLWGNPIYNWEAHKKTGFSWWLGRFRSLLNLVDFIRFDHFRGLAGYWRVPAGDPTAEHGEWVPGPGAEFLFAMKTGLSLKGDLPVIAEDLGVISEDVIELRDKLDLPGMKILQFAFFSENNNPQLFQEYNSIVYTGTHDNDTTKGWFRSLGEDDRKFLKKTLNFKIENRISWELIQAAWSSQAKIAMVPMQDLLSLGPGARMNFPGRPEGNWEWRARSRDFNPFLASRIRRLNRKFSRK